MNSGQQRRHVLYQLSKNVVPLLAVSVVAPSLSRKALVSIVLLHLVECIQRKSF